MSSTSSSNPFARSPTTERERDISIGIGLQGTPAEHRTTEANQESSASSIYSQLLAQILLLSFDDEPAIVRPRNSDTVRNPTGEQERHIRANVAQQSVGLQGNSVERRSNDIIVELLRRYTQNMTDYNTNVLHYNRNMERIIRLIETESRVSNTSILDTERNRNQSNNIELQENTTNPIPYEGNPSPAELVRSPEFLTNSPGRSSTVFIPNPRRAGVLSNNTSRIRFANPPYSSGYYRTNEIEHYTNIINTIRNPRVPSVLSTGGLSATQIQEVTVEVVYDSSNASMPTQCHISLDEFIDGEPLLQIRNCNHMFKPAGLRRWLSRVSRCPVCRGDVTVEQGSTDNLTTANISTANIPTANIPTETEDYSDMPDLIADSDSDSDSDNDYSDMPELVD